MICRVCQKDLGECSCEDTDQRIKKAAFTPGIRFATKWCRNCDKHHSRCECETPDFFIVMGGEEISTTVPS